MERGSHPRSPPATKAAETALPEHDALYRFLVEGTSDLIVLADAEVRFVYTSPSFQRLFGAVRALPLGRFHRDDREALNRAFCAGTDGEASVQVLRYLDAANSCRWLECSASSVHYRGEPHVLAVLRDVTDRERADEARRAHLHVLESLEHVNRAIHDADDVDEMLGAALSAVLDEFACDRAWLLHPTDPDTPRLRVVMERTRPEWPGTPAPEVDFPIEPEVAASVRELLAAAGVVRYGPGEERGAPRLPAVHFGVRSAMAIAIHPRKDRPYLFGLHQCSYDRSWTEDDARLFEQIAVRLASALRNLFILRDLRESESKLGSAERLAHVGYWDLDLVS